MSNERQKASDPKQLPSQPSAVDEDERTRLLNPQMRHAYLLIGFVYKHQIKSVADDGALAESAISYVLDLMRRFGPRDPVEEMLVAQMIQTHARIIYLNSNVQQQQSIKWAAMMHEAADRAANTFRRQMLALAEYRRPPRPKHFTAIAQANIAQQQVFQNEISKNENATNEQGSKLEDGQQESLPIDTDRTAILAGNRT